MNKTWFEATVRYERMVENGDIKMVSEKYLLEAVNPTEAEARITELVAHLVIGDFSVKSIVEQNYTEFIEDNTIGVDYFWTAVLEFITIDERTAKEKKSSFRYLVQASDIYSATSIIDNFMKTSVMDYTIIELKRTKLIDVYTK